MTDFDFKRVSEFPANSIWRGARGRIVEAYGFKLGDVVRLSKAAPWGTKTPSVGTVSGFGRDWNYPAVYVTWQGNKTGQRWFYTYIERVEVTRA